MHEKVTTQTGATRSVGLVETEICCDFNQSEPAVWVAPTFSSCVVISTNQNPRFVLSRLGGTHFGFMHLGLGLWDVFADCYSQSDTGIFYKHEFSKTFPLCTESSQAAECLYVSK
ncbi:hypothetical protein V1264_018146 [Littorina saxatilis]|uniref:Uncharacterized protein n=1 Tax=Littorina saxatilis TaxID=31220 RepID=A0AAN9GBS3_9CAEN